MPYRTATPPAGAADVEATELGADDLVVTSDAPARDRDPDPDVGTVSAQVALIILGTVALVGLAFGM